MRSMFHQYSFVLTIIGLLLLHRSECEENKEANACVDTLRDNLCEFAVEDDWCEADPDFLKRKCDYSCGWCSESKKCVDRATYLDCKNLTMAECNSNPEFYLSRCRKSCNWCRKEPKGAWRHWTKWAPCTTTCGPGFLTRTRICLTDNCRGEAHESAPCELKKCPTWNEWSSWSKCSVTCEEGIMTRKRNCTVQGKCDGSSTDTKECKLPLCSASEIPFDQWTPCSRSCDGGSRLFVFSCNEQDKEKCPRKYEDCNTHRCPFKVCTNYKYGSKSTACCEGASQRVIGGKTSTAEQWPWMARLEYVDRSSGPGEGLHLCGGTLIHPKFVLTAAHCFEVPGVSAKTTQIVLGSISRTDTSTLIQRIQVAQYTMHPNYSEPNNDLAIIKLKTKASLTKYVQTLCLPETEETPLDTKCYIAGWGKTHFEIETAAPNLMEARIRYLPFGACKLAYDSTRYGPYMEEESMVCAGLFAGNVDTCSGDSGGPLMCQRCNSCEWYLAGVTSFGSYHCGAANIPGVYMKIIHYEEWIVDFVEKRAGKGRMKCKKNIMRANSKCDKNL